MSQIYREYPVEDNLKASKLHMRMCLNLNSLVCFFQILHTVIGIFLHSNLRGGLFITSGNLLPFLTSLPPWLPVLLISELHTSK